jgi:hypothetical protein
MRDFVLETDLDERNVGCGRSNNSILESRLKLYHEGDSLPFRSEFEVMNHLHRLLSVGVGGLDPRAKYSLK